MVGIKSSPQDKKVIEGIICQKQRFSQKFGAVIIWNASIAVSLSSSTKMVKLLKLGGIPIKLFYRDHRLSHCKLCH